MRFLTWNVEKRELLSWSLAAQTFGDVDVALFQEYNSLRANHAPNYEKFEAISFDSYGTAVFSRAKPISVKAVPSPHGDYRLKFWNGLVYKTAAVATFENGLTVVSFHGFNGTLQGRNPSMLVDHVTEVMKVIPDGPCVFAGDFNTFTEEHHKAVEAIMRENQFTNKRIEVEYDARKTLDLVYSRSCTAQLIKKGHHESDHPYIVFDVVI